MGGGEGVLGGQYAIVLRQHAPSGEKQGGKTSTATAESIAAPTPGAGGMGRDAGILTGVLTTGTGAREGGGYGGSTLPLLTGLPLPSSVLRCSTGRYLSGRSRFTGGHS